MAVVAPPNFGTGICMSDMGIDICVDACTDVCTDRYTDMCTDIGGVSE